MGTSLTRSFSGYSPPNGTPTDRNPAPDDVAVVPSSARPTRDTLAHEMHRVTSHHWDGQTENHLESPVVTGNVSMARWSLGCTYERTRRVRPEERDVALLVGEVSIGAAYRLSLPIERTHRLRGEHRRIT
jgi:hypothetical protein